MFGRTPKPAAGAPLDTGAPAYPAPPAAAPWGHAPFDDPFAPRAPGAPPPDYQAGSVPPAGGPVPPPRRRRLSWRVVKRILFWSFLLFLALVAWLAFTAPLGRALEPLPTPALLITDASGGPIARRGATKLAPVEIADLPAHVPAAFIAIEDRRFRSHLGLDPIGIARAMWRNLSAGSMREGGSTITQQLAKTAFLTSDRTFGRKARELLIAFWLEAWLSKDEILERYLSSIYFGDGTYGIRAASEHYFGHAPEKLTKAEAAMLAGLVKAPSRLAPTKNLKGARARAELVEAAMVRDGALTAAEARRLRAPRIVSKAGALPTGTYFADWVLPQAQAAAGADYGEQRVRTTLDGRLQRLAVRTISNAPLGQAQAALVAMRPDGQVVAMVGGRSYKSSPFNRATQARRQPGSTFKLFAYLAALREGMDPDDPVEDRPITIDGWSPKNNDGRYRGEITLRQAFAASSNVAAVRLAQAVGQGAVVRAARDLGVRSPLNAERASLPLGTSSVTLLEMTSAYASVAAGRWPVRARGLPDVAAERPWYDFTGARSGSFGRNTLAELQDLLWSAANEGTGRAARLSVPTFGKTGTTQDNRDALFIGFAGDLVVGVWVGRDDNGPVKGLTGGGLPARIWRDFTAGALRVDGAGTRRAPPRRAVEQPAAPANAEALDGVVEAAAAVAATVAAEAAPEVADAAGRVREALEEIDAATAPPSSPPAEEDRPGRGRDEVDRERGRGTEERRNGRDEGRGREGG